MRFSILCCGCWIVDNNHKKCYTLWKWKTFFNDLMKKTIIVIFGALFLCGGLLGLHLAAQTAGSAFSPSDKDSLLHRKLEECSERELLERKVAAYRGIADHVVSLSNTGSPRGTAKQVAASHADLAAAEIELYRHTGEQEKLHAAHSARVEALTEKLRAVTRSYENGTTLLNDLHEAEIQLLDALLEQKREK